MQLTSAFAYAVSEYFCATIILLLLKSSVQIKHHNHPHYWFNVSLIVQASYLFLDGTRTLMMNRILPSNEALVNFASLCLAITLNILSYTTLMFVACKIELPLAKDKRQNRIVLGLPIAISIFDLVCSLFAPNLIFSANGINAFTPFFSTLFLLLPIGYSTFVFGVTAYNALLNRKNGLGHYYLVLSFYPLLMTGFGFIEVMLPTALPLYSYAVTFYFTFNFLYQLNFSIKEATIDSLTGLRNRENLKEYIDDIWKEGVSDQYYLFMIDMNGLKSVNDVYGHVEGDNAIRAIGQALDDVLQTGNDGIVCRYGGDEFLAVITVTDDKQADKLVQLTRERIGYYSRIEHLQSAPQVATGYIHLPKEKIPMTDLLKQADSKMYAEKQAMKTGDRAANFFTDEITGLPNANYFHNFAGNFLKKLAMNNQHPLVILFNISSMHSYNDRFGYQGGDDLLRTISRVLRDFFNQEDDVLVRYTEDNFVLLTCIPLSEAEQKIKAIAEKVESIEAIGIKAGIYQTKDGKEDAIATVDMARRAMRLIGSDRQRVYCVYGPEVQDFYDRRDFVLINFKQALADGDIKPFFQPVIRSLTGQIRSFEALARWNDPKRGAIPPDQFIGILEEACLIHLLDLEIFRQVCQLQQSCQRMGLPIPVISVNISPVDFNSCNIVAEIEKIRTQYQIPSKYLKIEVLESVIVTAPDQLKEIIAQLHDLGYEIWMDDFGSGYSSMNNPKDFDFDLLKIDMGFLENFTENSQSKIIISEIVDMSKRLGIETLCEGIESRSQSDFLKEIGCQYQQGYLFAVSMQPEELWQFLGKAGDQLEDISLSDYYSQIDRVNVLSNPIHSQAEQNSSLGENINVPMAIVEKDGDNINYFYFNHALKRVLEATGGNQQSLAEKIAQTQAVDKFLLEQMDRCQGKDRAISASYEDGGLEFKIRMRWLASQEKSSFVYIVTSENYQE